MKQAKFRFWSLFRSRTDQLFDSQIPILIVAVCLLPMPVTLAAQDKAGAPEPSAKSGHYLGSDRCDQCHFGPTPRVVRDFAMLTEASQFIANDKHSQAFLVLKGPRGQQIGRLLNLKEVTSEQKCLSCHANWQKGWDQPPYLEKGVSCESCHGPSLHWDQPHSDPGKWRVLAPASKADLGLVDVRNPVRRAEQCFSCHIGDVATGKVVTHEMYAAGHPPPARD